MSKQCGDTARFNRLRKAKMRRRASVRALRAELEAKKTEAADKPKA
jgi:hypothetical protein